MINALPLGSAFCRRKREYCMDVLYHDNSIAVCIKPPRVLSTDEPGGMPELVRAALGGEARTVHRLDRAVGGLMVLARSASAASELSRQVRDGEFDKEYLAVVHGKTDEKAELFDLLWRDKARKMTFVVNETGKGVQEASLEYTTLAAHAGMSLVRVHLITGRTHQIRCQFASREHPLVGDRKYGTLTDGECDIALWSHCLAFTHPETHERVEFMAMPPATWPWSEFPDIACIS